MKQYVEITREAILKLLTSGTYTVEGGFAPLKEGDITFVYYIPQLDMFSIVKVEKGSSEGEMAERLSPTVKNV